MGSYDPSEQLSETLEKLFSSLVGGGALLIIMLVALAVAAFYLFCWAKMYEKMDEPWWKMLIPIYGQYVWLKHIWGSQWWIPMFIPMIISALSFIPLLSVFGAIGNIVISIITTINLYKGMGRSTGFCVFAVFFGPIAFVICALSNDTFID